MRAEQERTVTRGECRLVAPMTGHPDLGPIGVVIVQADRCAAELIVGGRRTPRSAEIHRRSLMPRSETTHRESLV
jgi:hypothetical protein